MRFSIFYKLSNGKYGIKKNKENEFTKKEFNTRQAAINMAFRCMEFRHEKPYQVGNKILILMLIKMTVQSVRIRKTKTRKQAENIGKKMGYSELYLKKKVNQYPAGESENFMRFRQVAPSKFILNSFRTKVIDPDIGIIIGKL